MKLEVKKDRLEINKIIKNCLPLMEMNKKTTQECADCILVYFIEKDSPKTSEDKQTIEGFEYKCICEWSKDNEFGFVPNTKCPVHGKATKKTLSKCVPFRDSQKTSEDKK